MFNPKQVHRLGLILFLIAVAGMLISAITSMDTNDYVVIAGLALGAIVYIFVDS